MSSSADRALAVAVFGATGRMGSTITALIDADPMLRLSGAYGEVTAPTQIGGVAVTADPQKALIGADVAIDFTLPAVNAEIVAACVANGIPLVCGTTGLNAEDEESLAAAAAVIPVVYDHNMSLGVALLTSLIGQAAATLPDYDVEIVETHHRDKRDAPSGTAIKLGRAIADARGQSLDDQAVWSRSGDTGAREPGSIGFSSIRGGQVAGVHEVHLIGDRESLVLAHTAADRGVFAAGALAAARWVVRTPAGRLYRLADVAGAPH